MHTINKISLFGLAATFVAGCATIMDEKTQLVTVETPWCQAASCTLENDQGIYKIRSTPDSVVIGKSQEDLVLACERDGVKGMEVFESRANGYMTAGNILVFGGLLGVLVDDGSGEGYDYSTHLMLPLDCGDQPDAAAIARFEQHEADRMSEPELPADENKPAGLSRR